MYTVARLRGMENRFLEPSFFLRLLDSVTTEDALRTLGETPYSQWFSGGNEVNFDRIIDEELWHLFDELRQFVPDRELLDLYRMPYDFNNVKVILKSLFLARESGERRYDLLSHLGSMDTEKMVLAIEGEEYGLLPWGLNDVVPRCWTLWDQTKSTRQVELLLDEHLFASMRKLAEKLKMPAVVRWVRHKTDAENLKNAVRLQRLGFDAAAALPFFHRGGTLRPDEVAKLLGEPLESWGKSISHAGISATLDTLQDHSDVQVSLSEFTKALDNYLIRVLEKAKYISDAPENVLLYLLQKDMEVRNLRTVLVCVANGLNREFARRLLGHGR
ncbi:MAG: V-type ATPase subunit [Synergistaceae bacterium]|jgi:V/A-type H+-transporting ATPase subunit C|nr:V-type ATPase subunit [Synergistaceae bacterium]